MATRRMYSQVHAGVFCACSMHLVVAARPRGGPGSVEKRVVRMRRGRIELRADAAERERTREGA
jgi:hypothetical protein